MILSTKCNININVSRSKVSFVMEIRAFRDIKKGEEVTANYIGAQDMFSDAKTRQAKLMEICGFQCSCSPCSSDNGN